MMLTEAHKRFFAENGYVVVPGLFSAAEVERYRWPESMPRATTRSSASRA
jgi:hypothetical protein